MKLSKKIKTGLDETRTLILGAQILLGFQFREVFSEMFGRLPARSRYLDAVGLGLMVIVVALLVTPGPYHRIVVQGGDDEPLERLITHVAEAALLPFALALGIDIFITVERALDFWSGLAASAAITTAACAGWYGLPLLKRRNAGHREDAMRPRPKRTGSTPLETRIEQMLTEARVILPGAQALFGFQLSIVLMQAFDALPASMRAVHAASLCLVAVAVILLMAPAAYHRIVFDGEDTESMHRIGSVMMTAATVPLAIGLSADVYVVIAKITGSNDGGLLAGGSALALLFGLWHIFPLAARRIVRGSGHGPG